MTSSRQSSASSETGGIDKVPETVRDFYQVRGELSEMDGLVVRGSRIVVPTEMRKAILERIHDGHQGLGKCRERANQSVWWPRRENKSTHRKEPLNFHPGHGRRLP